MANSDMAISSLNAPQRTDCVARLDSRTDGETNRTLLRCSPIFDRGIRNPLECPKTKLRLRPSGDRAACRRTNKVGPGHSRHLGPNFQRDRVRLR